MPPSAPVITPTAKKARPSAERILARDVRAAQHDHERRLAQADAVQRGWARP